LANPCLHYLDIGVGEHRLAEPRGLLVSLRRLEYAVDHATVNMEVLVERRAEAVYEAHRPPSCLRGGSGNSLAQDLLDHAQEDRQYGCDRSPVVPKEITQPLGQRQHPLAHRQRREDMIDQVGGGLRHAPGCARRAYRAPFAGKSDQEVVTALRAPRPCEATG